MARKFIFLFFLYPAFISPVVCQSLKDKYESQSKTDAIEKMRQQDEAAILEAEKSKSSIDVKTLMREGFTLSCSRFIYDDNQYRSPINEITKLTRINSGFGSLVIYKTDLVSVLDCNLSSYRDDNRFCAKKVGIVELNGREIEFKRSNLTSVMFFPDEIKEWAFDTSTNTLYALYTDHPPGIKKLTCEKIKWKYNK
jgi:hypothetical protein